MIKTHEINYLSIMHAIIFSCIAVMMFISSASAAIATYTLDNIMQDNNGVNVTLFLVEALTPMMVPAALCLFASGLIGLTMIGKRKVITYRTASLFR